MGSGPETHGYHGILHALRGKWEKINYGAIRDICRDYRDGSDKKPGSDNWSTLAYLVALLIAWLRPDLLPRIGLTRVEVIAWWSRELTVRLRKGLQLTEVDSRIYCIFSQAPICWLWRAFRAMRDEELTALHSRYVRATAAQVALCSFPVRPERLSPEGEDNPWPVPIHVPIAGSRSFEPSEFHHMLHSAFEMFAAHLLDLDWSRGGGSQTAWAREVTWKAETGWMGLSHREVSIFRNAVRSGDPILVDDLMQWLDGVGTLWPCRLVRFERGAACMRLGRSINSNTAPLGMMAIHEDGTVHYLAAHTKAHGVDGEPCGVNEFDHGGDKIQYNAWIGGEDWPLRDYEFKPKRWGKVQWDIHIQRDGNHVVRRPREATPVPPPEPGPEPPAPPRREKSTWVRYRVLVFFGALAAAAILLQRACS